MNKTDKVALKFHLQHNFYPSVSKKWLELFLPICEKAITLVRAGNGDEEMKELQDPYLHYHPTAYELIEEWFLGDFIYKEKGDRFYEFKKLFKCVMIGLSN